MADRYLVASGDWSSTSVWSATSGGAPGASVPTSSDDVYLNAASGAVTLTVSGTRQCRDLNCTGFTGTLNYNVLPLVLEIYGSLTYVSGMTVRVAGMAFPSSAVNLVIHRFKATTAGKTIAPGGKSLRNAEFDGVGGEWSITATTTADTVTLTNGTLKLNGFSLTTTAFYSSNRNARALDMSTAGSSYSAGVWFTRDETNFTFLAGTSTVTLNTGSVFGALAFNNLTVTAGSVPLRLPALSMASLTLGGRVLLTGNVTLSGTLTVGIASSTAESIIISSGVGTQRTITCASAARTGTGPVHLQDVSVSGATLSGSALSDMGGNAGITFPAAVTRYWVGNAGSWSSTTKWSASSGGTSGASVPLAQDAAVFDTNSFSSANQNVTIDYFVVGSITTVGVTNTPRLVFSGQTWLVGSLTLSAGVGAVYFNGSSLYRAYGVGITFSARSAATLTSAGFSLTAFQVAMPGATLTLQDDARIHNVFDHVVVAGTLSLNGFSVIRLTTDNAAGVFNPDQADLDGDGIGDPGDSGPGAFDPTNSTTQTNAVGGVVTPGSQLVLATSDGIMTLTVPVGVVQSYATVVLSSGQLDSFDVVLKTSDSSRAPLQVVTSKLQPFIARLPAVCKPGPITADVLTIKMVIARDSNTDLGYGNGSLCIRYSVDLNCDGLPDATKFTIPDARFGTDVWGRSVAIVQTATTYEMTFTVPYPRKASKAHARGLGGALARGIR